MLLKQQSGGSSRKRARDEGAIQHARKRNEEEKQGKTSSSSSAAAAVMAIEDMFAHKQHRSQHKKPQQQPSITEEVKYPTTWEAMKLKPLLLKGIQAMGFVSPSAIQQRAVIPIVKGRDVVAQSQSGTGKTAVFCVAALQIVRTDVDAVQVMILSPTRELAEQTYTVASRLGDFLGVRVAAVVGGGSSTHKTSSLSKTSKTIIPHIVSGTPARVLDLVKRGALILSRVSLLVVDEADHMIACNYHEDIYALYRDAMPKGVQAVLISATMSAQVLEMSRTLLNEPLRILIKEQADVSLDAISQYHVRLQGEEWKYDALCDLYDALVVTQAVVFCNTRDKCEWLAERLTTAGGFVVGKIHGDMTQEERSDVMNRFRCAAIRLLVATDVWGRGLDVQQITLVVNFDIPRLPSTYIHRIGRSGRWGRRGIAINFLAHDEDEVQLREIISKYKLKIDPLPRDVSVLRRSIGG